MAGDYRGNYIRSSDHASSCVKEDTTSSMYSVGKESMPTEWTDEKHSLYLKSMEASFIDQLYNSLGSKENKMSVRQPHEYRINGRHGGSSRHEFLRSPWMKPLPKSQTPVMDEGSSELEDNVISSKGLVICSSGSTSNLKNMLREGCSHSRDLDQISIGEEEEEVSDQNFVDEVTQGENGSSKKMKMSGSSSTDHVVPLRKIPANMM